MTEWQPIETAPKLDDEGEPQLLVLWGRHDRAPRLCYWDDDPEWWQVDTCGDYEFCALEDEPTHWAFPESFAPSPPPTKDE